MRSEIEGAIALHSEWADRLRRAVASQSLGESWEFVLARVRADDQCSFGTWLFGPNLAPSMRQTASFRRVRDLHADFHGAAAEVVMLAATGNAAQAVEALDGDYAERAGKLIGALRDWQAEVE